MAHRIDHYTSIVGEDVLYEIYKNARLLCGKSIVHINSTYYGGGVVEILSALVPLLNDAGVETGWRHLRGSPEFFTITKKFHNALQGDPLHFTDMKKKIYVEANEDFSLYNHLDHNCVIIHDPQPLPLINFYKKQQPWVWRVHVDFSHPDKELWDYFRTYLLRFDAVIISHEAYRKEDLPVDQHIIHPAIDPLSPKNMELSEKIIDKTLKKYRVPTDKPFICQISRFDKWKDPEGVIDVFRIVKEKIDCRLVLCGSAATDDPESNMTYERVKKKASQDIKTGDILLLTLSDNILVNVLQRKAAVIMQKSLREGFGLTVTEGLWKGRPVVASNIGGIPLQIEDGENGFLIQPQETERFADTIIHILKDKRLTEKFAVTGPTTVKKKFLITRLCIDYLHLINDLLSKY
ncbi:glycosyltransferase [candidate division WOR-3 bacterium]|nr:glycosyltransferase [candidate division WOR-3 bacterium]